MSEHNDALTIVLSSSQAACIGAWLQKSRPDAVESALPEILAGFAARLEDARWIGHWLREEARLEISCSDSIAIGQALREVMQRGELSEQEGYALNELSAQLQHGSVAQLSQVACRAPLSLANADAAS